MRVRTGHSEGMKKLLNAVVNWVSWHRRLVGAVLAAGSILLLGNALASPGAPTAAVVVATRLLPAGHGLTEAEVAVVHLPLEAVPDDAATTRDGLIGRSTAVALPRGTVVQPALLAASHSTEPGRALVPIALRDPSLRALLAPGDQISLITAGHEEPHVLTDDARVAVLATPPQSSALSVGGGDTGALILVDVPSSDAVLVASLGQEGGLKIVLGGL